MSTGEIIPFISSKSGVGKTTSVINIAHHLANLSNSVCIVDMDMFFGELHMHMNLEQFYDNNKTLYQLLKNKCTLDECLIHSNENICILPSSRTLTVDNDVNFSNLSNIFNSLKEKFNYILLDIPFDFSTINFFNVKQIDIDKIIFISTHNLSSVINTDSLIEYFELKNITSNMYLIITNYLEELDLKDEDLSLSNINDVLKIPLLGTVKHDKDILLQGSNSFYNKKSNIYKEYELIIDNLLNINNEEHISDFIKKDKKNKKFLSNKFLKKHPKKILIDD